MPMQALLLDRDGVINIDHGYVHRPDQVDFVEGVFDLARAAVDRGYRVCVVTNQAGIARGYYAPSEFHALTDWMKREFERRGAALTAVFHCPYLRGAAQAAYDRDSFWRKPNPGMILEARDTLRLDLARSVFVGDQPTDMAAARAAGVGTRVLIGEPDEEVADADALVVRLADVLPLLSGLGRG